MIVAELKRYLETIEDEKRVFIADFARLNRMEQAGMKLGWLRAAIPIGLLVFLWVAGADSQSPGLAAVCRLHGCVRFFGRNSGVAQVLVSVAQDCAMSAPGRSLEACEPDAGALMAGGSVRGSAF